MECNGCPGGTNDPARIRLLDDPGAAHSGRWSLHLPAEAAAGYQGASLTYRSCVGDKRPGCQLEGHEALFLRTWVRLAEDHQYVHHFLELAGTRPNAYWESDGNAGCRPNGYRWAGTTLDFNRQRELFFYTYFPDMRCDRGGYCSGDYARQICAGCAAKDMPCPTEPECCWGNHFGPAAPAVLPRGEWACLELGMRLNTPGVNDGWMAFWQDDVLIHEEATMAWRDVPELQLNKAWLMHYIAAGDASQSNRVWFDDVVVSTQHIGCGAELPPTPEPSATPSPSPTAASPTPGPSASPTAASPTPGPPPRRHRVADTRSRSVRIPARRRRAGPAASGAVGPETIAPRDFGGRSRSRRARPALRRPRRLRLCFLYVAYSAVSPTTEAHPLAILRRGAWVLI